MEYWKAQRVVGFTTSDMSLELGFEGRCALDRKEQASMCRRPMPSIGYNLSGVRRRISIA